MQHVQFLLKEYKNTDVIHIKIVKRKIGFLKSPKDKKMNVNEIFGIILAIVALISGICIYIDIVMQRETTWFTFNYSYFHIISCAMWIVIIVKDFINGYICWLPPLLYTTLIIIIICRRYNLYSRLLMSY